jgi:hypothetical protein
VTGSHHVPERRASTGCEQGRGCPAVSRPGDATVERQGLDVRQPSCGRTIVRATWVDISRRFPVTGYGAVRDLGGRSEMLVAGV